MATAAPNFGALLDRPASEVERPKPLPQGTYVGMVAGLPRQDKSSKKQTEFLEFTIKVLEPMQVNGETDVDMEALEEMGGLNDKTMRLTFYLTDGSLWRLKDFITDCGIEIGDESIRQLVEETPGKQVGIYVSHVPSQDGSTVFAQISKTLKVE